MDRSISNTWLTDEGLKQIDFYVSSADVIVVERNRTIKILYYPKNNSQGI